MAANDLDPCVPWSWSAATSTTHDKQVLVFQKEGFRQPEPSRHWESMEEVYVFLCFLIYIPQQSG